MSQTVMQTGFSPAAFEEFLARRNEPNWLIDRRRAAWQQFNTLPMPGRGDEEWMRTDIRTFHLNRFSPPAIEAESPALDFPPALLSQGVELAGHVITHDSRPVADSLKPKWAERGVLFGSLDRLVAEHGEQIKQRLFSAVKPETDKFAALHAACWSGGTFLYVPRGVVIDEPLHSLSAASSGGIDLGHTLAILEEGAEATLLAETVSDRPDAGGLHCGAIELLVGNRAQLRYVNLQNWGSSMWHFAHQKAMVGADARIQWTIGALGAKLAQVNQHVALVGTGAEAQVNGVMFTEGKQQLTYNTHQHHMAPNCRSDLLYKGALQDKSRVVWRGMIKVDKLAQKTDGYQRNDNLILSEQARADSIPGLEIEADDVRCTHGSTAGRVDDEQIFYLRCRGLTRKEAVRIVVTGFFQQVFDRITIDSVREALGHAIGRRIREYD